MQPVDNCQQNPPFECSLISKGIEIAATTHWLYLCRDFVMKLHFGLCGLHDVMNSLVEPDKISLI